MLGQTSYYYSLLTKYVSVFGAIFNDVFITRFDSNGYKIADIKVPISYSVKEKMLLRVIGDPEINRQLSELLPRMSFELIGVEYDGERKLNSIGRKVVKDTNNLNVAQYQFNDVPYNLQMNLYVYTQNIDDGNQIIEQILPFFTPDFTSNVELIGPPMNQEFKIPIVLNNVQMQDTYDGEFKNRQVLLWTLSFTIRARLFGPVYTSPLIKFANVNLYADSSSGPIINTSVSQAESVQTIPTLTANGQPTSNVQMSIPVLMVPIDSNWGYSTNLQLFGV